MWPNPQFPEDLVTFTEEIFRKTSFFVECTISQGGSTIFEWFLQKLQPVSKHASMTEAATQKSSVKKPFWRILYNSHENTEDMILLGKVAGMKMVWIIINSILGSFYDIHISM